MRGRGRDRDIARSGRSTVRARVGRDRRILLAALLLSGVLHLLAIGVLGGLLGRPPAPVDPRPSPLYVEPPAGMRAVAIAPSADPVTEEAIEPVDRPRPEREDLVVLVPVPDAADDPQPRIADDRSAADRLAPRLVDPRLWRPMVLIPREPTLADVQARLDAAVELLSDSALADAERAMRAVDWTVEDADGGRWGVSPGKLHLGKLTLPLPIYFTVPGYDPARAEWYDLEAQVDRTRFLESFEDRVRAIRERREREREEGNGGGDVAGGGGGDPGG